MKLAKHSSPEFNFIFPALVIFFVSVISVNGQTAAKDNNSVLTKNDLWQRYYSGFFISSNMANGESELINSNMQLGCGFEDFATFSISNHLLYYPEKTSYLPGLDLSVRPSPFIQMDFQVSHGDFEIYSLKSSNPISVNYTKEKISGQKPVINVGLIIDSHIEKTISHIERPGLYYYFPNDKWLSILGNKGYYIDFDYKSAAFKGISKRIYELHEGTKYSTNPLTGNSNNRYYFLKGMMFTQKGLGLELDYAAADLKSESLGDEQNYDISKALFSMILSREEGSLNRFGFNSVAINGNTNTMLFVEQRHIFGQQQRSIGEIKQNSDNFFGRFPKQNEFILSQKHFYILPKGANSGIANLTFNNWYGFSDHFYFSFGLNYLHAFTKKAEDQFFPRLGMGYRNYNHTDVLPPRTIFSDLTRRTLPPWKFRFELHSLFNATTDEEFYRKHEFEFQAGLPEGINFLFYRKVGNYWGNTVINSGYPFHIDLQKFTEFPVDDVFFFRNTMRLQKQFFESLLLEFDYNYYEFILPYEDPKAGHEIWGKSNFVFNVSFLY